MVTIGVKLFYKEGEEDSVVDTAGFTRQQAQEFAESITNEMRGVQNIPELQTAPSAIDVTSLEDTEEQSEPGLISGSSLALTMNYKEGIYSEQEMGDGELGDRSNFQKCLNLSNHRVHAWKIVLPNGRWFAFYGKCRATTGALSVASALQFTLSLFKRSRVFTGYTAPTGATESSGEPSAQALQ